MPQIPELYATSGYATVGLGTTSHGNFNVQSGQSVSSVIMEAFSQSPGVVLGAGTWQLDYPLTFNGEARVLVLGPGCVLRNCASGSTGIANVTGARCRIVSHGGKIDVANWVNSQNVINVTAGGDWFRMRDIYIDCTASTGNTSTPMNVVRLDGVLEPDVCENVFIPNKGFRGVYFTEGHGGKVNKNYFRNTSLLGIGAVTEPPTITTPSVKCYEGIRIEGAQWFECCENVLWGLGDSTDPLNEGIYYNRLSTPASSEEGHFKMDGNRIEECYMGSGRAIGLFGASWFNCDRNKIGWLRNSLTTLGQAAIYVGGRISGGTEQGTASDLTNSGTLIGNEIHNVAASHAPPIGGGDDKYGAAIYLSYCKNLTVGPSMVTLSYGYSSMVIDLARCDQIEVYGHHAHSNDITGELGILLLNNGGRVRFIGCRAFDFQSDNIAGATPSNCDLTGLEGYELSAATISADNGTAKFLDSGNGLAKFKLGGWVWIEGTGASTNAGKFFRVTAVNATGADITVTPAPATVGAGQHTIKQIDTNRHYP